MSRRLKEWFKVVWVYYRRSVANLGMFLNIYTAALVTYLFLVAWLERINIDPRIVVLLGLGLIVLAGFAGKFDYSSEGTYAKEAETQGRVNPVFQIFFAAAYLAIEGKRDEALALIDEFYFGDLMKTLEKSQERMK